MGQGEIGRRLRSARLARGWTLDDVAVALHHLEAELNEAPSSVDLNQVSKWERGARRPGRRYQPRLCLIFDAMPAELGFVEGPRLLHDVGELRRRQLERPASVDGALEHVDRARLAATIKHLWPADRVLVDGLARTGQDLAARTDAGPAGDVLPDLRAYLDQLHALLGRSQRADIEAQLKALASAAAQHAGFLADSLGWTRQAYAFSAEAELLAREAGDRNRLAEVLIDRAEQLSRRASGPEQLAPPIALAEAALATMDGSASAGLRGWAHGQASADFSAQGEDIVSGRHLDAAYRATAGVGSSALNLFSDYESAWLESYRGLRALHLGQAEEAQRVFEAVLGSTDPRLFWERSRALYRLAWALALRDEVERSCELLVEAVALTSRGGDARGLAAAARVRAQQLGRWRTDPAVRRLDQAIRAAR